MLPKAIVFDVDGVLLDTEVMICRGWKEVSTRMGRPQVGQHYMDFVGQSRKDIVDRIHRDFGADFDGLEFLERVTDFCVAHWESEGLPFKPGLLEILDYLEEKQVPMALATSTRSSRTKRRMEITGLGHYFQAIVTGDMVPHSKPHPDIYLTACERLGVAPADAIAVEDAPNGIRSAYDAGMQVVMVPDQVPYRPELEPMLLACLPSLTALRDYLAARE